jgi:excisionase family DNA binding protein
MSSTIDTQGPLSTHTDLGGLLSPSEVADLLGGVSERTVRRLVQQGVLDRVRIGHRTSRYTRRSVLALIDPHDMSSLAVGPGSMHSTDSGGRDARRA